MALAYRLLLVIAWVAAMGNWAQAQQRKDEAGLAADAELVETRTEVPRLKPPAEYKLKDGIAEIELSEYAGYAGLIAANNGLAPSNDSIFFKKHGFKVKLTISEEESWSALNSGQMAASATTVDVLAVYGQQLSVKVPGLIGFSRGADGIVVRNGIKKINDLKGKVVTTCQFTEADFLLRYLVQETGTGINMLMDISDQADPEKVNVVFCTTPSEPATCSCATCSPGETAWPAASPGLPRPPKSPPPATARPMC